MAVIRKRITANYSRSAKALDSANQKRFTDAEGKSWRVDVGHSWFPVDYPDGFLEILLNQIDPDKVSVDAVPAVDPEAEKLLSGLRFEPCR